MTDIVERLRSGEDGLEYAAADEIERLRAEAAKMRRALIAARGFIRNGVEFGFVRMPDPGTPDTAHDTLPIIEVALAAKAPSHD